MDENRATSGAAPACPDYPILPPACLHPLTPLYDLGCSLFGFGRRFKRRVADRLDARPGMRVLDLACGTGVLAAILGEPGRGLRVDAVDPDEGALGRAARRIRRGSALVRLVRARAEALPFADRAFDRVVCTLAFHHIPDAWKGRALAEVARVLAPAGRLLLVDFDNCGRRWVVKRVRSSRTLEQWLEGAGLDFRRVERGRLVRAFEARLRPGSVRDSGR